MLSMNSETNTATVAISSGWPIFADGLRDMLRSLRASVDPGSGKQPGRSRWPVDVG
jgi:hypothetical protein